MVTFWPEPEPDRPEEGVWVSQDEPGEGEEPDFIPDDITADGHRELEQLREQREFSRIIVWDMPLLYSTCNVSATIE